MSVDASRPSLVHRAFVLEYFTIGWMLVEAGIALWSGLIAHSITLLAFGADSAIELVSAFVLLWRLTVELRRGQAFSEMAEERASKIGAALLCILAAYVILSAGWSLWNKGGEEFSTLGLAVALVAIPTMYLLAKQKLSVAAALGSSALRADAVEAITCGYLSVVVVVGLVAQLLLHAWWVDGVTSLAIVYFLIKEAKEAWDGDGCECASKLRKDGLP